MTLDPSNVITSDNIEEGVLSNKNKKKVTKNAIGILRTTLRNNIDLTSLADNKANVLLSLNAVMLTFLAPLMIPYMDLISQYHLGIPLIIFVATCLYTIYLSVMVLRPGKLQDQEIFLGETKELSPFFFGSARIMRKEDYLDYLMEVMSDEDSVSHFMSSDFYHIGYRLAEKMKLIRQAFNVFMIGLVITISTTLVLLFIH